MREVHRLLAPEDLGRPGADRGEEEERAPEDGLGRQRARAAERRAASSPGRAPRRITPSATANAKEGTNVNGPHETSPQAAAPKRATPAIFDSA